MEKVSIKDTSIMTGIYLIEYPNGKFYIGQAQNIHLRILDHNSRAKTGHRGDGGKLQPSDAAIRKYYPDGVQEYFILEQCAISELDTKEKYWIEQYDAMEKGYNLIDKGNASGRRGINHINASLTQQQLEIAIELLCNHFELSYKDIAEQVGTSVVVIQRICWGQSYFNDTLSYPLRENNHESAKKDNINDYFKDIDSLINLKEDLKYSWWLQIEKDLVHKYNIPLQVIRDINNGRKFEDVGEYQYPLRNKNIRNTKDFSKEDILSILDTLRNSSISMVDICSKYNIGSRNTLRYINNGQAYIIKDYDYPARLTKR